MLGPVDPRAWKKSKTTPPAVKSEAPLIQIRFGATWRLTIRYILSDSPLSFSSIAAHALVYAIRRDESR